MRNAWFILPLLLASCAPQEAPVESALKPYQTAAPSPTSAPNVVAILETPQPTSTPFVYTIQAGDTFSGLAERFRVSQDELQAANPGVSPHSLPIGGTLLIPDPAALAAAAQTPTPEPLPIAQLLCHSSADGLWCFALIQNAASRPLEAVSAQISLLDENGNEAASQTAFAPLNQIPPGAALPLYAFFPNMPARFKPQARLLSAIQTESNDPRRFPITLSGVSSQIAWDGRTAKVGGRALPPPEAQAATQIRIAAVAYDQDGRVTGLKIWEGSPPQFSFIVASLSAPIERLEFFAEARP